MIFAIYAWGFHTHSPTCRCVPYLDKIRHDILAWQSKLDAVMAIPEAPAHQFVLATTLAGNDCPALVIPAKDHHPITALIGDTTLSSPRARSKKRAEVKIREAARPSRRVRCGLYRWDLGE